MTFSEILDRVGSMGRFQFLHVAILGLPILNMANHNLLQIFTAATPVHHCRPPPNASTGPWVLPMGPNGKPERCLRFVHPPNASLPNETQRATEPCLDGWVYNSTKDSIVTEWDLVCNSNKLKEMAQSIFMAGILIGGLVLGDLSDRCGMGAYPDACHHVDSTRVLLHLWPVHSARPGLRHPPVALAAVNCVHSLLHLLPIILVDTRVHTLVGLVWKVLKGPEDTPAGGCLQWQEGRGRKALLGGAQTQPAEGDRLGQGQVHRK
uniref:Uncharacterized protein DKFZp469N1413 n=1 Tax=Pongo abelii TaxID=9601 RepID=Q5RDC4_PONAB|nr:hypothetical protein [Pongo abelii]